MKKIYEAPVLEIEIYELDADIAGNCGIVVNNGPLTPGVQDYSCDMYVDPFSIGDSIQVNFYENNCDCYTTGNDKTYWTS